MEPINSSNPAPSQNERPAASVAQWTTTQSEAHAQADEIIRQVDYYFSEENLPQDAYLLGFTGKDGTGPVSLSLITGFKKMKQFRPRAAVREALKGSSVVEIVDAKHIKRRHPLTSQITAVPRVDESRYKKEIAKAHPHLPPGMLKPTGFEPGATEGPVSPEQYQKDQEKYGPDESIINRLETAVNSFAENRKMHQDTLQVFTKFMIFGGLGCNPRMFQGGATKKQMKAEGVDKEDMPDANYYGVVEQIKDASYDELDGIKPSEWVVDFEALAEAFMSSQFLQWFDWYEVKHVKTATQVLRNFYNYLMVHSVCPEYNDQLLAAREVCNLAEEELPKLAIVDRSMPGAFNSACSTLAGGSHAGLYISKEARDGWAKGADNMGLDHDEAGIILKAGIAAYGTEDQSTKADAVLKEGGGGMKCVSEDKLGLEIIDIEVPTEQAKEMYAFLGGREEYKDYVHPMGKLICVRWDVPFEAPVDLPAHLMTDKADKGKKYEFLIEAETLKFCEPGMKMEATVCELDIGFKWIDSIDAMYPTFFTWLPNEGIFDWKAPGPPNEWMKRQDAKKNGVGDPTVGEQGNGEVEDIADYDDEEPD